MIDVLSSQNLLSSLSHASGKANNGINGNLSGLNEASDTNSPGEILQHFGSMLNEQLVKASQLNATADQKVESYAAGGDVSVHQVMIAMEQAGGAMDLAVQVRNKLVTAYQEVMRIAV